MSKTTLKTIRGQLLLEKIRAWPKNSEPRGFANGLVFGAGWWQSALGAGGTAGPACVRNASAAVDRTLVQLATIHDRSRCLENVGLGGLTVAACSSSPLQLWVRRNFLCLRASPALFKWRVV